MAYQERPGPETRNSAPMPPYNSPLNPNFTTFSNQPQFPLDSGSKSSQLSQNTAAMNYYAGFTMQISSITANPTPAPHPTFKTEGERLLYLQGQMIAATRTLANP